MGKSNYLKNIDQLIKDLEGNLIQFGLDYINKHNLNISSIYEKNKNKFDLCMKVRDNVLYRIGCVNFHLRMLLQLNNQISSQFRSDPFDETKRMHLLIYSGDRQLFFLDDIVFHLVSLLDYLGNLIGFCFYGEDKKEKKWKWIKKCCEYPHLEKRETGKEKIGNSAFCPVVRIYQKKLWNGLEGYRGCRIHIEKDSTTRKASINLMNLPDSKFVVSVPVKLQKLIKKIMNQSEEKELTLSEAAKCLVDESFRGINEILIKLREELKKAKII